MTPRAQRPSPPRRSSDRAGAHPLVHLVDGHVYIFRAWHSMPEMPAPDGLPTGAAHGFASALLRILGQCNSTHLAVAFDQTVAFDQRQDSFRTRIFPSYKSSRGLPPPELEAQFDLCRDVTRALGIPVFECADYEADDCLATAAETLITAGADVVIVSTDKDLAQLVREDGRIRLHDLAKETTLDSDGVQAKFGVPPARIPDWLALVGDAVDDLPGVPGFGAKTAAAVLTAFGPLEALPLDERAGRRRACAARRDWPLHASHREQALKVRTLATVQRAVPGIDLTPDGVAWRGARRDLLEPLFDRLDWHGIRRRIPRWQTD